LFKLGLYSDKAFLKSASIFNYLPACADYGLKVIMLHKDLDAGVKEGRACSRWLSKGVQF